MSDPLWKIGDRVRVSDHAPFHAGRTGRIDIVGTGPSLGQIVILADETNTERAFRMAGGTGMVRPLKVFIAVDGKDLVRQES